MGLKEIDRKITENKKALHELKHAHNQIVKIHTTLKYLKTLKRREIKEHEPKYVVLCGARAHFDSWGNHDMTTSYADKPSGYGDIGYYNRFQQIDFFDTFTISFTEIHKNFSLKDECCTFNKHWLHKLYRWLAKKPLGNILVKLAKQNTIRVE